MYCPKCGTQLPDDAAFCLKCGTNLAGIAGKQATQAPVLAPAEAKSLNCPSCGAPINPQFGEMVITCSYCGTTISLSANGWKGIAKQTMLPVNFLDKEKINVMIHDLMDQGLLHRHLQENSTLEEMNLSLVPYWIVSASARTNIVASDVAMETGQIATTAALFALIGAGMGGRRGGFGIGMAGPLMAGTMLGGTMAGRGGSRKNFEFNNNYNFPVVALKALAEHQPKDYQFDLQARTFFDVTKVPKEIKILNGDVGEEAAKQQAKALVDQLQSDRAHAQYHLIQQINTEVDVGESELLHAPIWFARYNFRGQKIALVIDANSGAVINSIGLR